MVLNVKCGIKPPLTRISSYIKVIDVHICNTFVPSTSSLHIYSCVPSSEWDVSNILYTHTNRAMVLTAGRSTGREALGTLLRIDLAYKLKYTMCYCHKSLLIVEKRAERRPRPPRPPPPPPPNRRGFRFNVLNY